MMKYAHTITVTAFIKPEEQEQSDILKQKLREMMPVDFEKEKLAIKEETAKGFNEREIKILKLALAKESHTNIFLKNLKEKLSKDQKYTLLHQQNRMDDELNFYMRLHKPQFLEGNYILTDEGDCIHIKMHIAAFPKRKDTAWGVVQNIFND